MLHSRRRGQTAIIRRRFFIVDIWLLLVPKSEEELSVVGKPLLVIFVLVEEICFGSGWNGIWMIAEKSVRSTCVKKDLVLFKEKDEITCPAFHYSNDDEFWRPKREVIY